MMTLEEHGPDTFVGAGPRYPWGGLYGGQIVAQALRAAAHTVDPGFGVHSLHAYFIRRGDQDDPVRYEVDRIRNGRSFVTRRVIARQAVGAILNLSASFQVHEDGPDLHIATPVDVAPRAELAEDGWSPVFRRRTAPGSTGLAQAWLQMGEPIGDDPLLQACALAYLSDDLPTEAVVRAHPVVPASLDSFDASFMSASLDHAMWFHRPVRADEWHLHEFRCEGLRGSRGLALGRVFDATGLPVATVSQEVLLRQRTSTP